MAKRRGSQPTKSPDPAPGASAATEAFEPTAALVAPAEPEAPAEVPAAESLAPEAGPEPDPLGGVPVNAIPEDAILVTDSDRSTEKPLHPLVQEGQRPFRVKWRFEGFRPEPLKEGDIVFATSEEAAPFLGKVGVLKPCDEP